MNKTQLLLCLAIGNVATAVIWNPPVQAWDLATWVTDSVNGVADALTPKPPTEIKTVIGGRELIYTLNPAQHAGATPYSSFGEITDREAFKLDYLAQPQRIVTLQRFLGSPAYVGRNVWYYDSSRGQVVVYLNGDLATWQFIQ